MATLEDRVRDLERRMGLVDGQFEFVSGQRKDVHRTLLSFENETNKKFEEALNERAAMRADLKALNAKVDALPTVIAELIAEKK